MSRLPALALGLALALPGCGERPRPNLLLIVVDTLRRDHLGCYGYERDTSPEIDALAAASVRFDRAYAAAPWTQPSVASMLTGLYPGAHTVEKLREKLPESARTLAEILRDAGYATAGVASHVLLGPGFGFGQGFEHYATTRARGHHTISTPEVLALAGRQLAAFAREERPFFLFVHFFDPHYLYKRHRRDGFAGAGAGRLDGDEDIAVLRSLRPPLRPAEVAFVRDLYDEEIRFTDAGIGSLLARLEEAGLADDTWVVFTADHGEEFLERGWLGHTRTLYDELIRVPLLVRPPGGARPGRVRDEPVTLAGLAPTLLELAGVEAPPGFQAPSFAPLVSGRGTYAGGPLLAELDFARGRPRPGEIGKQARGRALIDGRYKLIVDGFTDEPELYDLTRDPDEREDLAGREPERVRALRARLAERAGAVRAERLGREEPAPPDAAERALLRQLGYLED